MKLTILEDICEIGGKYEINISDLVNTDRVRSESHPAYGIVRTVHRLIRL
jgi:hypothetical protein